MNNFLTGWQAIVENSLLYSGLALSQYVVLRAGVFSISTVGYGALGAYAAAIATLKFGLPPALGVLLGLGIGALAGFILFLPVAHLRGVFQAIASFAFVQIVQSLLYYSELVTGGSNGLNGIPKVVGLEAAAAWIILVFGVLTLIGQSRVGRAFDAIRQDETVAVTLGINVRRMHTVAFMLSGAIAGASGAIMAYHDYSLMPETFGFALLVNILSFVVLGGYLNAVGPVVGTFILVFIPEVFRVFADYRPVMTGLLLIAVMIFLPKGIVGTLRVRSLLRAPGASRADATGAEPAREAVP